MYYVHFRFVEIISKENCIPIEYSSFHRLSGNNITLCTEELSQNFMNSVNVIYNILDDCSKACTTFQYRGTCKPKLHGSTNSSRIIDIGYWFNNENEIEIFQEYLIYWVYWWHTGIICWFFFLRFVFKIDYYFQS